MTCNTGWLIAGSLPLACQHILGTDPSAFYLNHSRLVMLIYTVVGRHSLEYSSKQTFGAVIPSTRILRPGLAYGRRRNKVPCLSPKIGSYQGIASFFAVDCYIQTAHMFHLRSPISFIDNIAITPFNSFTLTPSKFPFILLINLHLFTGLKTVVEVVFSLR